MSVTTERTEYILVDSSFFGGSTGAAMADEHAPTIGLLLGSQIPDSRALLVLGALPLHRCMERAMSDRLVFPQKDRFYETLRRIKNEQVAVLGYYICDPVYEATGYGGIALQELFGLLRGESICEQPILLRLRRILHGSTASAVDAGIQAEFFRVLSGDATLKRMQFRIIDRAYLGKGVISDILEQKQQVASELMHSSKSFSANPKDLLLYDAFLSQEIRKNILASRHIHGLAESTRLAQRKVHLRWILKERIESLQQIWKDKQVDVPETGSTERFNQHVAQLLAKEMSIALADVQRRLPMHANISFYERPIVTLKAPRSSIKADSVTSPLLPIATIQQAPAVKKTKMVKPAIQTPVPKGPLRPILPLKHSNGILSTSRPLSPIPAADGSDPADHTGEEESHPLLGSAPL